MWNQSDCSSRTQMGDVSFSQRSHDMDNYNDPSKPLFRKGNEDGSNCMSRDEWSSVNQSRGWSTMNRDDDNHGSLRRPNEPHSLMRPMIFEQDMNFGHTSGQNSENCRVNSGIGSIDANSMNGVSQLGNEQNWKSDKSGNSDTANNVHNGSLKKNLDQAGSSTNHGTSNSQTAPNFGNASSSGSNSMQVNRNGGIAMLHSSGSKSHSSEDMNSTSRNDCSNPSSVPFLGNLGISYPQNGNGPIPNDIMRWQPSSTLPSLGFHMNPQNDQTRQMFNAGVMQHFPFQTQKYQYIPGNVYPDQSNLIGLSNFPQIRGPNSNNLFQMKGFPGNRQPGWNESFGFSQTDNNEGLAPPHKIHRREGSSPTGHTFSQNMDSYSPVQENGIAKLNGFHPSSSTFSRLNINDKRMNDSSDFKDDSNRVFLSSGNGVEGLGALVAAGAHVEGGVPSRSGPLAPPPVAIERGMYLMNAGGSMSAPASKSYSMDGQNISEGFLTNQTNHSPFPMDIEGSHFHRRSNPPDLSVWHSLADQSRRLSANAGDCHKSNDQIPEFWSQQKMGVTALENSVFQGNLMAPMNTEHNSGEKDFVERYDASIWSHEDGMLLKRLVEMYGTSRWSEVARNLPGKSEMQCLLHWRYALNEDQQVRGIGSWSVEEDARLKQLVELQGTKWAMVARNMPGRVAKQCRERYLNHLDPALHRGPWSDEEEQQLLRLCEGNNRQWAEICRKLPGRSYNDVKNRYNLIQRRLRRMQRSTKEPGSNQESAQSPKPMKTDLEVKIDYSTASPSSQSQPSAEELIKCERNMSEVEQSAINP